MHLDDNVFISQLRIGNFVLPYGVSAIECVREVCLISLDIDDEYMPIIETVEVGKHNNCDGDILRNFQPIPLTEEWMIRLGFFKSSTEDGYGVFSKDMLEFSFILRNGELIFEFENYQLKLPDIKLLYIHQLQNLYFTLTGEDLKLPSTSQN